MVNTYRGEISFVSILALDHVKENGNGGTTKLCIRENGQ